MSSYYKKRYLDIEFIKKEIQISVDLSKDIKDVFIVLKNNNVLEVFNESEKVFNYVNKGKKLSNMKEYQLVNYVLFIKDFIKETNKYRTYNNFKILKYHKTIKYGKKPDLELIRELNKNEKVKFFFREEKLKRILNETN